MATVQLGPPMPWREFARPCAALSRTSTPDPAAIASAFSIAVGASSITTTRLAALSISVSSETATLAKSSCGTLSCLLLTSPEELGDHVLDRCQLGLALEELLDATRGLRPLDVQDRKSTRLNSSHANISYAV